MELRRRLVHAVGLLAAFAALAVVGFRLFAHVPWLDALYMVVISLSGVGYHEIVDTSHSAGLRAFNIAVLVGGFAAVVYVISLATAVIVQGEFGSIFRRRRMEKRIATFQGHYLVCGAGETGTLVVAELGRTGATASVVDLKRERLEALPDRPTLATVEGDATDLATLERAGLDRAACVVTALPHEKDNLVVTVLVRQKDPSIRIVARHVDPLMADRLRKAGADAAVSPTAIGSMRLASEAVRPHVVGFLDQMLKERAQTVRIEEIPLAAGSPWIGKTLGALDLRKQWGLTTLALRDGDASYRYGPEPEEALSSGTVLIVLGDVARIAEARASAVPKR
ncbi:MAG TPA: potassium channel protein [Candidatus Polarisedimenticolaceae bacterium]|nr:potassium channel protein [Candidatus Polarisedimenticolaceae bacterium]